MNRFLIALLATIAFTCPALADDKTLTTHGVTELPSLAASSLDSATDYMTVYDASANNMVKVLTPSIFTSTATAAQLDLVGANPGRGAFNICGDATTVNNNTIYYGPSIVLLASTFNGQTCDIDAAGNATEATADAPIYTNKAVNVLGMTCRNEGDLGADISYTLRTAAGATVPSVTCTIADNERDCVADVQTTTPIAAGATVAVAVASTADVGANAGFNCSVEVSY